MSPLTVNQLVDRLAQPGPLELNRFAALLGASLAPAGDNPYWTFYTFALPEGPFARGELRLNRAASAALLILEPRDPPGVAEADLDTRAWGPVRNLLPNPRVPPEGVDTEEYAQDGVKVSAQWTHTSRRLASLVLEWAPRPAA
jgi:hypothetical protein